jgi:glycosyltransferase involved in cell wall biosynthesis
VLGEAAILVAPGDPGALADALLALAADHAELARLRAVAARLAVERFAAQQVVEPLRARLTVDLAEARQG